MVNFLISYACYYVEAFLCLGLYILCTTYENTTTLSSLLHQMKRAPHDPLDCVKSMVTKKLKYIVIKLDHSTV